MRTQSVNDSWTRNSPSPCLYLGPRGERCARPAQEDGFCELHAPDGNSMPWARFVRRVAAAFLLIAFLWLILGDFVREVIGRFR